MWIVVVARDCCAVNPIPQTIYLSMDSILYAHIHLDWNGFARVGRNLWRHAGQFYDDAVDGTAREGFYNIFDKS